VPERSSKTRPRDLAQLAKFIVDESTGEHQPEPGAGARTRVNRSLAKIVVLLDDKSLASN
jgi:hypothetical protein